MDSSTVELTGQSNREGEGNSFTGSVLKRRENMLDTGKDKMSKRKSQRQKIRKD